MFPFTIVCSLAVRHSHMSLNSRGSQKSLAWWGLQPTCTHAHAGHCSLIALFLRLNLGILGSSRLAPESSLLNEAWAVLILASKICHSSGTRWTLTSKLSSRALGRCGNFVGQWRQLDSRSSKRRLSMNGTSQSRA